MSSTKVKLKTDQDKYISLLKMIPDTIESGPCCVCVCCECNCLNQNIPVRPRSKCRDKNNINNGLRKRKTKKSKRSKSANSSNFTRDCVLIKDMDLTTSDLPNTSHRSTKRTQSPFINSSLQFDGWPSSKNELQLCESMYNLCLVPDVRRAYRKIPVHDQKIINRMARSRSEKAHLSENAWLAKKFWENEKYERSLLKCEQEVEYKQAIREKQDNDYEMTKARLETLSKRDLDELKRLRENLYNKDTRLQDRLQHIKLDKAIMQCQRRQDEYRRSEAVQVTQEEQIIENEIRKQDINHCLEYRLAKADCIRQQYLNAYTRRLKYDNYMEQVLHEENFKETEKFENFKKEKLKESICNKACRTEQFVQKRRRNFDNIVERAKISASLRDLVRRSVSPDGGGGNIHSAGMRLTFYDRPVSNLSYQNIKFS